MLTGNALGLIGKYDALPTYYTYIMYKQLGRELVESSSADPLVSITAALREDGALTVLLVNRGEKEASLSLSGAAGVADEAMLFDDQYNAETVDVASVMSVADGLSSVTLPKESIVSILFK